MLGLVHKPEHGTIELVTQATRGSTDAPRTVYVGISKMIKKVPQSESKGYNPNEGGADGGVDPEDDIFIGEENGEHIYVSKKALKDSIHNGQILSALLYESQRSLNKED